MQPLLSIGIVATSAPPSPPAGTSPLPPPRRRIAPPLATGALLCSYHARPRRRQRAPPPMSVPQDGSEPHALEQRAVVTNKHGEKLVGVLHHTGSSKIVVLCHGFISTKNDSLILDLAAALTKKGISVFRFDFSGNGESEGEFEYGNYRKEADDLHSVVSYLCKEKYDVTAIVGHSKGGDVVALYASIYDDVCLVINVSGRFDLEKGIEERIGEGSIDKINKEGYLDVKDRSENVHYRVTKESLTERLNTDVRAASISISKDCRFFTVHGSADKTIPVEDAYEFAKHIPNHKLQVIEGANHNYTAHRKELADTVVDFITSN
ncbi:non-haem bromoperoxidase BPO-A2-like isoform X2 [Oryza brachyantha]|uniref:Serine aminopeptidase S33 domain-containing protein n=1 Tax=Oryza brachyantha TaxID=4533 RepID=J3L1B9_ORYBR|nr:non-haem bromoperoxidase BPO-A2-like isoform X2 [Oryza brachyantha]